MFDDEFEDVFDDVFEDVFELLLLDVFEDVFELVLDDVFDEVFELELLEEFPATLKLPSCLATGAFSASRPTLAAAWEPTAPAARMAADASVEIVIIFMRKPPLLRPQPWRSAG